ncbi:MAG: dinitrogenase iron-molybdenum cofactor biosynthesis protein [Bacteroidetes bacterium]|jgi:predicted Fe-Mo cluster-binding NifX family protein|nr:dinitrogenase iron-molybdenum cofactor biosynthesis protein [Bacteroidota bacterium]
MKIAITSSNNNVSARFDKRFGRAEWICLYNDETRQIEFMKNRHTNLNNGAGTKTAEKMISLQVDRIISGDFGPKAKNLLDKFEIQVVVVRENNLTVEDIIQRIK